MVNITNVVIERYEKRYNLDGIACHSGVEI